MFADASDKLVEAWRARAARSYPSDLRAAPEPVRLTLLAALCSVRQTEITDALVELLIGLVHKLNVSAERRVERELTEDLRRVRGKESILFQLAAAAVEHPDETVRKALFPVVRERTLRDLVREAKANEVAFRARVRTVLRSSYSGHYRRGLPPLLAALQFRCNNAAYRPVMDAHSSYGIRSTRPVSSTTASRHAFGTHSVQRHIIFSVEEPCFAFSNGVAGEQLDSVQCRSNPSIIAATSEEEHALSWEYTHTLLRSTYQ